METRALLSTFWLSSPLKLSDTAFRLLTAFVCPAPETDNGGSGLLPRPIRRPVPSLGLSNCAGHLGGCLLARVPDLCCIGSGGCLYEAAVALVGS